MATILPIIIYFLILLIITIYLIDKKNDDQSYFLANRKIHPFLALVSIVATETSVATVVIFPQAGKSSGFLLIWLCAGYITGRILIARYYLKKIYENHKLSMYSTVSKGNIAKNSLSLFYLFGKFISSGVRFFMGGAALYQLFGNIFFTTQPATGIIAWVLLLAFFAGLYSLSGGLRAVIITDQLQGYIILGLGITLCLTLLSTTPLPTFTTSDYLSLNPEFSNPLFSPILFLAGLVLTIGSHATDQDLLQRALSTSSLKKAQQAIILSGFGACFVILIYLFIGFLLRDVNLDSTSTDYPLIAYIKSLNSPLLTGSFAVLLFAAAMSTLDSAIHSTGAIWKDILGGNKKGFTYSFLSLLILILFAIGFSYIDNKDFLKLAMGSMNYAYGGLIGVVSLYIFTKQKISTPTIIASIFAGFIVTLASNHIPIGMDPQINKPLYLGWTWITIISALAATMSGWIVSKLDIYNKVYV